MQSRDEGALPKGPEAIEEIHTTCCIVGGGPAGIMLGFLLARAGVDVLVLEKHSDFLDDFRGDMIHPSTMEAMDDLGLLEDFLTIPHQKTPQFEALIGKVRVPLADFCSLKTRCPYIAFMPQKHFLSFIADEARRYPTFRLLMGVEVTDLVEAGGVVTGVRAAAGGASLKVGASLVIGADGRKSRVRDLAGLEVTDFGSPIDVLWMRIPRRPGHPAQSLRRVEAGRILVMIDRGDYFQCAFVIPKGAAAKLYAQDIASFRQQLVDLVPALADGVEALASWSDVRLLSVAINRLKRWHRPGLLCIGDAAHAMSPVSGVGINLAIQDAIAAANILGNSLREGTVTDVDLAKVERRRYLPTRVMHFMQLFFERGPISQVMTSRGVVKVPFSLRLLQFAPPLRHLIAWLIGMGIRRERVTV